MRLKILIVCHADLERCIRDAADRYADHILDCVGAICTPDDAPALLKALHPDVVILDPSIDNGRLLHDWRDHVGTFPVLICATADPRFAVDAFEAGAVHYLDASQLDVNFAVAIGRAVVRVIRYDRGGSNGSSAKEWEAPFKCKVIALPHASGIEIRGREEVVSAHGEGNYTRIILQSDPPMLMSKPIGEYEEALTEAGLVRVHRSHMVNVDHIRRVRRGKSPVVQLSNGAEVDVSDSYRDMLFSYLQIGSGRRHDRD